MPRTIRPAPVQVLRQTPILSLGNIEFAHTFYLDATKANPADTLTSSDETATLLKAMYRDSVLLRRIESHTGTMTAVGTSTTKFAFVEDTTYQETVFYEVYCENAPIGRVEALPAHDVINVSFDTDTWYPTKHQFSIGLRKDDTSLGALVPSYRNAIQTFFDTWSANLASLRDANGVGVNEIIVDAKIGINRRRRLPVQFGV